MAEVLTQQEIDRLLGAISTSTEESTDNLDTASFSNDIRKVKIYDFKRPDVLRRYQLRELQDMCDIMAQKLTGVYAKYHNTKTSDIHVISVDILTTEEYYQCLPSPSFLYKFDYGDSYGCVDISPEMVLRGFLQRKINFNTCIKKREFDSFDIEVCKKLVFEPMLSIFRDTIQKEVNIELPQINNVQYIDRTSEFYYIDSHECGTLVTMEMKLGSESGMITLIFDKKNDRFAY